jgi:hypothetical protein
MRSVIVILIVSSCWTVLAMAQVEDPAISSENESTQRSLKLNEAINENIEMKSIDREIVIDDDDGSATATIKQQQRAKADKRPWGADSPPVEAANLAMEQEDLTEEVETKRPWESAEKDESEPEEPVTIPVKASSMQNSKPKSDTGEPSSQDSRRRWGAGSSGDEPVDQAELPPTKQPTAHEKSDDSEQPSGKIPFVRKAKTSNDHAATPPEGFQLAARVYIDTTDKLAHFDTHVQPFPYWDCGWHGSTTSPLPLKDAYFRNALSGATFWSGTDGKHAVLAVALTPVVVELNSGESLTLRVGQVILLEDVLKPGHKIRPLEKNHELLMLFLTLPQQYYATGINQISLPASFLTPTKRKDPCPNVRNGEIDRGEMAVDSSGAELTAGPMPWTAKRIRKVTLALIGVSLSTLAADFMGKTFPLWLAVGIGGTSFVAGATWAIVTGGDFLFTTADVWLERRKLTETSQSSSTTNSDDQIQPTPATVVS